MSADWSLGESVIDEVEDLRKQLQVLQQYLPENIIRAYANSHKTLGALTPVNIPGVPISAISSFIPPTENDHRQIVQDEIDRLTPRPEYDAKRVSMEELIPYIERGWEIASQLSDAEFIVRRRN
jgi:hypothetical protein